MPSCRWGFGGLRRRAAPPHPNKSLTSVIGHLRPDRLRFAHGLRKQANPL